MKKGRKCIYALVDPMDSRVRYVGQAKSFLRRTRWHLLASQPHRRLDRKCTSLKDAWLDALVDRGLEPFAILLEECAASEALDRELVWIERFRASSALLNNHDGTLRPWGARLKPQPPDPIDGANIRALRTDRGWSQAHLAKVLGVSYSSVSLWESGKRRTPAHLRLALDHLP